MKHTLNTTSERNADMCTEGHIAGTNFWSIVVGVGIPVADNIVFSQQLGSGRSCRAQVQHSWAMLRLLYLQSRMDYVVGNESVTASDRADPSGSNHESRGITTVYDTATIRVRIFTQPSPGR